MFLDWLALLIRSTDPIVYLVGQSSLYGLSPWTFEPINTINLLGILNCFDDGTLHLELFPEILPIFPVPQRTTCWRE